MELLYTDGVGHVLPKLRSPCPLASAALTLGNCSKAHDTFHNVSSVGLEHDTDERTSSIASGCPRWVGVGMEGNARDESRMNVEGRSKSGRGEVVFRRLVL